MKEQIPFQLFRSEVQHEIKRKGAGFILEVIKGNSIHDYFQAKKYPECFYLLACIDTLCIEYSFPLCEDYDEYRKMRLSEPLYLCSKEAEGITFLPEFTKYNIYEGSIYDVC